MSKIILPDIISVGIYNSQLAQKNKTITKPRKTAMFEIELPLGHGGVSYIDDQSHKINENILICSKPGQMRHTKLPFMCYYIHLIINEGKIYELLSSLANYIEIEDSTEIKDIFLAIYDCFNGGYSDREIMMQSMFLRLVYALRQAADYNSDIPTPKVSSRRIIEDTIRYINQNLSSELTLEILADRANFSSIYFHRLFKSSVGKNLHEYITEQRIKKSVELLISTDKGLSAIAYECGFSSQSYFSSAFKKFTGYTPREYAKRLILEYGSAKK